jgi:hypothetical protein
MTIGDWINVVLAVATVAMAAGTLYLAKVTQNLVKDTVRATQQADRHHQENLRPFCVIAFSEATEQQPFGSAFDPEYRRRASLMSGASEITQAATLFVCGALHNKGKGLAKEVLLYLNMRRGEGEDGAYRLTRPVVVCALVGAEEVITIDIAITVRDIMHSWDGSGWKPIQIFSAIAGDAYELVLEYKDVFDNTFRTVHPRGIWTPPVPDITDPAKRQEMMVRQDKPTPSFLTGRQAIRLITDIMPPVSVGLTAGAKKLG